MDFLSLFFYGNTMLKTYIPTPPNQYPVFADAVNLVPSLQYNASAQNLFNFFLGTVSGFVDPGFAQNNTNSLSLFLILHFMTLLYKSNSAAKFDPQNATAYTGAIMAIEGEKVGVTLAGGNNREDAWETDLSQTIYGQMYLDYIYAIRNQVGIDGRGGLWASV